MTENLTQDEKTSRGAEDAGQYFRYMMDFVGFTAEDALAIRESALVIEKHIPAIVADFYAHLLRYPPTRVHFIASDGNIDHVYLQKRMSHLSNFWRRTASGEYDDAYARYIDYVGMAHTNRGADPKIYIAERYVIGQVGFMQRAIIEALMQELREYDPDLERRAVRAWNLLMMVILELLSRAYEPGHVLDHSGTLRAVNRDTVHQLAVQAYELGLGLGRPREYQDVPVGKAAEIPDGQRKIIQVGELSVGVFHHNGEWYALRNHCAHAGGPVCTGTLQGNVLTCPWHGFQYDVTDGHLLVDDSMRLETYRVTLRGDEVFVSLPDMVATVNGAFFLDEALEERPVLMENEFLASQLLPGNIRRVMVDGEPVVVANLGGQFYALQNTCTHQGGPLHEGWLEGESIVCPWHDSCFDLRSGAVTCPPAQQPARVYRVEVEGAIARVTA